MKLVGKVDQCNVIDQLSPIQQQLFQTVRVAVLRDQLQYVPSDRFSKPEIDGLKLPRPADQTLEDQLVKCVFVGKETKSSPQDWVLRHFVPVLTNDLTEEQLVHIQKAHHL
jgi:hypothetical protein